MRPLLLLALLASMLVAGASASSSSSESHSSRSEGSSHHRRRERTEAADDAQLLEDTTPWGPFTFTGALNASTDGTDGFFHFTLPTLPGSLTPQLTPSLAGAGAVFTLESTAFSSCSFVLCSTRLVRAVEDTAEWTTGLAQRGRSDVCEAFWNATAGTSSPGTINALITPGLTHFAVYARSSAAPTQQLHSHSASKSRRHMSRAATVGADDAPLCPFTLTVSGSACSAGLFGTASGCETVNSTAKQAPVLFATLPASPPDAVVYFEAHPTSVYTSSLTVNVSSSADNITVFVHEGALPSVIDSQPLNPLADTNVTAVAMRGDSPIAYDFLAAVTIQQPSYRVQAPTSRYFLGVTRTAAQQAANPPTDTQLAVQVVNERVCPSGYHGKACEFFAEFVLDPFNLAGTSLARIATTQFAWSSDRTSIWKYVALIFMNIDQAQQNFSIGIQALDGQLVPPIYLRMGQIPTLTQFDARSSTINSAQSVRYVQSGPTLLHDAVWYIGINVPLSYPRQLHTHQMGDVALFVNTPCPFSTPVTQADGSIVISECNGHGRCLPDVHQCLCSGRYIGFDCMTVDQSMGLSGGARALIIIMTIAGTAIIGFGLCWWFKTGMDSRRPMADAGVGHHLQGPGPAGGRGGGGGAGGAGFGARPPMGRI